MSRSPGRRRFALMLSIVCNLRSLSKIKCSAFSARSELAQVYRDIAQRSNDLNRWPDSENFRKDCLIYDSKSQSYKLPEFHDGHGSLGVFGFLHRNNAARSILTACDDVFLQFASDIRSRILSRTNQEQQAAFTRWLLQSPPTSHHISVAILQEHPIFLHDERNLEKWKPISDSTIYQLATSYSSDHPLVISECPKLQLDSLLWTPDGALIAGFIDQSSDQGFEKLRQSSRSIARTVLGDVLTTRPKNLIHATVGRVIGLPPGASDEQYQSLTELACQYNQDILPQTLEAIFSENNHGGAFTLQELSLARNKIWMMQEYKEYATWSLVDETLS